MSTRKTRILSMLLAMLMIFSLLPMGAFAAETGSDTITVIACSDFQNRTSDSQGQNVIRNIMSRIQNDHPTADGFLCCGDYSYGYSESASALQAHITALDNVVSEKYSDIAAANRVYIQGNHDKVRVGTGGLANSGNNDPTGDVAGKYGVFVINEDDYMWGSNKDNSSTTYSGMTAQEIVQQTANNLDAYLSAKKDAGFTAPIFVLSHLPLHYSMRTSRDGDGTYANLIFNVLNRYGEDLNIIFLYGHDHSHGWDDYLGGAAVYLEKGDSINIAQGSKTSFRAETLNFTYMNAGFTGYYEQKSSGAEDTLTMTAFEISGNKVEVNRYSADGVYNLKSAGVWNGEYNDSGLGYSRDTRVIPSPAEIILTSDTPTPTDPVEFNQTVNGITVTADGGSALTVNAYTLNEQQLQLLGEVNSYVAYDINVTDLVGTATVKMPVPAGYASGTVKVYHYVDGAFVDMNATIQDGYAVFTTDSFSPFVLANTELDVPEQGAQASGNWTIIPNSNPNAYIYELVTSPSTGTFLISDRNSAGTGNLLGSNGSNTTATVITDSGRTFINDPGNNAYKWTVESGYKFKNNSTNQYFGYNVTSSSSWGTTTYTNTFTYNTTSHIDWTYSGSQLSMNLITRAPLIGNSTYSDYYIHYNNGWKGDTSSGNVYLYKQANAHTWAQLTYQPLTMYVNEIPGGGSVEDWVRSTITVKGNATNSSGANGVNVTDYTLSSNVVPGTAGNYSVTVQYKGVTIGTVPVSVINRPVIDVTYDSLEGTVSARSASTAHTGTNIYLVRSNGAADTTPIPVTLSMLSGSYDINTPGTYTGLTLKYTVDGTEYTVSNNYTLVVTPHIDWKEFTGAMSYKYTLDKDGINSGKPYLIVASGTNRALVMSGNSLSTRTVTINGDDIIVDSDAYEWTFGNTAASPRIQYDSNSRYLYSDEGTLATKTGTSDATWTASHKGSGQYVINQTHQYTFLFFTDTYYNYLRYSGSTFSVTDTTSQSTSNTVRLYQFKETITPPSTWIGMSSVPVYVTRGISEADLANKVTGAVDIWKYTGDNPTTAEATALDPSACTFDYSGVSRNSNGTYTVPVKYNNTVIGSVKVVVAGVDRIDPNGLEGTVEVGSSNSTRTGTTITAVTPDGTASIVNVTVGMLSGNFDVNTPGTYSDLTINYDGKTVNGYTLIVTPKNPYPLFPNEGSVRVGKTASSEDFQTTGVAKVELTATGVPIKKGIDVIVMLDTSSSMGGSAESTRLVPLRNSIAKMLNTFKTPNSDGSPQDIRIAIADFNGYTYLNQSTSNTDTVGTNSGSRSGGSTRTVFTGTKDHTAGAFVDVNTLNFDTSKIKARSGTNYDDAFQTIYDLGEAITAKNKTDKVSRDLVVIFMSDGAPFQYNYFWAFSNNTEWNEWLQGTYESSSAVPGNSTHKYFYNVPGNKLRMAEAVKGDPNQTYEVIKVQNNAYSMQNVPGLGATVYSIGFALEKDDKISVASMEHVLQGIASNDETYFKADDGDKLDEAFTRIAGAIKYAATNARFIDTMGADYDLQMEPYGDDDDKEPIIQVINYETYKTSDVGKTINGELITAGMVGKRTGAASVIETVTFATDSNENIVAISNKHPGDNILKYGVISADNFWYNTTQSPVNIDTDGDGTEETSLAPETFYWKMGTINESELALSYYVYLTGSTEGTRPAGSYPTNENATLYYTNYLDNPDCFKETIPPRMPWQAAHVSYAFYLVDQNGNVITNTATGATGSFADKIAITNPIVFGEILLNSSETVLAMQASQVVPSYYELYDKTAAYTVNVGSGNNESSWLVTKGTTKATTYVTDYNGAEFSNTLSENDQSYDYTHTIVWFAVKYQSGAIDDTVVIDYGLPVDISVLANDMIPSNVTVAGIATNAAGVQTKSTADVKGTYGTLSVVDNGHKLRYTLSVDNGMQMSEPEVFYYGVVVDNSLKIAKVTVIPATTVYYEDSFVQLHDSDAANGDLNLGVWSGVVLGDDDVIVQAEDRPGTGSVAADANNVYGYDPAYGSYKQFSLGTYQKVTVDAATGNANVAPSATFTFTGTGFDVISLTDNRSGLIMVTVTNKAGNVVKRASVDNYFGYKYTPGEKEDDAGTWTPVSGDGSNALYQVPVIKVTDLAYDTYNVCIQAAYLKSFDVLGKGSYSFWLDAIRVYDPAMGNATAEPAYEADKESAPDYAQIRQFIIAAKSFFVGQTDEESSVGIVFIDGIPQNSSLGDYKETGPNNETYLNNGQAIAIQLVANEIPDSVQIGAKLANGESATLFYNGKEFRTLKTATDMYYTLTGLGWKAENGVYTSDIIILENASENGGVISLTNLKVTGGATFMNATAEEPVAMVKAASAPAVTAMVSPMMASRALSMINTYSAPVEYVYPEIISVDFDSDDIKVGDTVTATIVASADTDYITVNGQTLDACTYDQDGNTVWTYTYTAEAAGEVQFVVTAANENGTTSADRVFAFSVSEPEPDPEPEKETILTKITNAIKSVFDTLFGWIRK